MIYFANPTKNAVPHMEAGTIGFIATPRQGQIPPQGVTWCLDNNCFGKEEFNESKWWAWLQDPRLDPASCLFATAPDVVGDAAATLERSTPWLPRIRSLGYPVAFVLQDGSDQTPPPWGEFDVLFIGGTTEFKLGEVARDYVAEAKRRGMFVHMGRVNSLKRLRYAEFIGVDSADGTVLTFGPDRRLPEVLGWVHTLKHHTPMFGSHL